MNNISVNISSGIIFKAFLIGILFVVLYLLRDLVLVLLTAVVIASSIEPLTQWFIRYKVPRVIAVIFIYLALIVSLLGVLFFFLPPLLEDISGLLGTIPQYLDSISTPKYLDKGFLAPPPLLGELSQNFSLPDAINQIRAALAGVSGGFFQTINVVFGGLFSFILILVISFYLAVQEKGIENFLRLITPLRHEKYIVSLWKRSQRKIGLWMQGQLLLGLIVGVLVYLGLTILGVKYAFLLAILAVVFELIPLFGPILSAIPAVILGFLDSVTLGFMVLGLYVIIQQFENHLIYPLVVRKVVGVSPIIVIISLVIGAQLAGFLGLLLAVPVAAALMEFADDIQKDKLEEEKKLAAKIKK